MTKDEFVAMCKELLEHGAVDVSAGMFRATFRQPAQQYAARREPPKPEGSKPPAQQSAEDARHGFYDRLMGGGR
jgi:hypothetical protein